MVKNKKESFFWTSYADLMTSLFFVMLVLFVLTSVVLSKTDPKLITELREENDSLKNVISKQLGEIAITKEQLKKIEEIEQATKDLDSRYFAYNDSHKKHILQVSVSFPTGVSSMDAIDSSTRGQLLEAGKAIKSFIDDKTKEYGVKYLLVIEGQASRDSYTRNFELSYERALSLSIFWKEQGLDFGDNCELLISGTGTGGVIRDPMESRNQRFLINLIPKPGVIEQVQ